MKSRRNKTLDLPLEDCAEQLERCLFPAAPLTAEEIRDKVICGDFFAAAPLLPEKCFDLVIADPPYNLRKDYGGEVFSKKNDGDYADFTRRWLTEVRRLAKDDASVYVCCDWETGLLIAPLLQEFFIVRNRITWQREKGRGARRNWKNVLEDIWFATVSADYCFHPEAVMQRRRVLAPYREGGKPKDWEESAEGRFRNSYPSNFWDDISVPFWSMPENTPHPAQKPEKLMAKLILASTDPGDTVLDPFLGSGSSAVTAKKLGRHYVGIEREAAYCAWAEKRLELAETDKRIQGYADGVFWERNTAALMKKHRG